MLGHLPRRYLLTTWIAGLVTFTALGAWLAFITPVPLLWPSGALLGVVLGTLSVPLFLHVLDAPREQPETSG